MENMSNPRTLIIADDEPLMRQILAQTLMDHGFSVLMAENGNQAFSFVKANRVDLVVTDLNMPQGGGLGLLKSLHESEFKNMPVIVMTGNPESYSKKDLYGATILFKPFRRQELVELVKSILNDKPEGQ